ncbi:MAG: C1 family peptidase [Candidatus Rokuibacteriota bacterium]
MAGKGGTSRASVALPRGRATNGGNGLVTPEAHGTTVVVPAMEVEDLLPFGPQHRFPDRRARGLGWLRDHPDIRDATIHAPAPKQVKKDAVGAKSLHQRATEPLKAAASKPMPPRVDNRRYCSPIEDQGNLGSCTAQSCAGLVEYMERRASGRHVEASRLFLYKVTRKLLGWTGDTGAFLRATMKALVLFGAPPEEWWPYRISTFDRDPDPFLYAYAANYQAVRYLRLDALGTPGAETLKNVKAALARGYAVMFGFSVYSSLGYAPDIPYPQPTDSQDGGHAVLAVGYDDSRPCAGVPAGALLIRNSWGAAWGDQGYGWLPYEYVVRGLADDFWTCYKLDWVDSGQFA